MFPSFFSSGSFYSEDWVFDLLSLVTLWSATIFGTNRKIFNFGSSALLENGGLTRWIRQKIACIYQRKILSCFTKN